MDVAENYDNEHTKGSRTDFLQKSVKGTRKFFDLVSRDNINSNSQYNELEDSYLFDRESLLKQTWNTYGVSFLFNFENSEVKLKQYAKKLREEVANILSKEDVSYDAKIEIPGTRTPKETDHPSVTIEVFARINNGEVNNSKSVYTGHLLSWRSNPEVVLENTTKLPLLLCRGTTSTMKAVHLILSRMFDCQFITLTNDVEDFTWLLPIILSPGCGQDNANNSDEARLEYVVPGLPVTDTITIKFHVHNLINLWSSFQGDVAKVELSKVKQFHEVLQHQIKDISNLEIGLCICHRIHLPSIIITGNKMKIMNLETMDTVLTYLNEKSEEALYNNSFMKLQISNLSIQS